MAITEVKPSPEASPAGRRPRRSDRGGAHVQRRRRSAGERISGASDRAGPGAGSRPGMIVIHEAMGLNEHIRDMTNRFANLGYVALGVDLYTREGGPPPAGDLAAMMKRLFAMSDATVLGDLEGAADFLRAREDVRGRIGCIGFCMGGRYTLLFAARATGWTPPSTAGAGSSTKPRPKSARPPSAPRRRWSMAARLSCALLGAIGAEDPIRHPRSPRS